MTLNRLTLPTLLLALVALTSCGGDDESAAADPTADPTAGSGATSSGPLEICSLLTPEAVGEVLGGDVSVTEVPGGGCSFDQEDPRAPSVGVAETPYDEGAGGMDGTQQGIEALLDGSGAERLDGIGDDALVAVGTSMGGESQQGGGAVLVAGTTVQLTVLQAVDLPAEEVRAMVVDLLTLVADVA